MIFYRPNKIISYLWVRKECCKFFNEFTQLELDLEERFISTDDVDLLRAEIPIIEQEMKSFHDKIEMF